MHEYGKRKKPVAKKTLSPEALARWRLRERNLLAHEHDTGSAPAPEQAVPEAPLAADAADHGRHAARHKTLIHGQVVFNDLMSTYDCTIRDLSETGALIKLHAPVEVPKAFMLRFGDGQVRQCKVRRRKALELAIEFLD